MWAKKLENFITISNKYTSYLKTITKNLKTKNDGNIGAYPDTLMQNVQYVWNPKFVEGIK